MFFKDEADYNEQMSMFPHQGIRAQMGSYDYWRVFNNAAFSKTPAGFTVTGEDSLKQICQPYLSMLGNLTIDAESGRMERVFAESVAAAKSPQQLRESLKSLLTRFEKLLDQSSKATVEKQLRVEKDTHLCLIWDCTIVAGLVGLHPSNPAVVVQNENGTLKFTSQSIPMHLVEDSRYKADEDYRLRDWFIKTILPDCVIAFQPSIQNLSLVQQFHHMSKEFMANMDHVLISRQSDSTAALSEEEVAVLCELFRALKSSWRRKLRSQTVIREVEVPGTGKTDITYREFPVKTNLQDVNHLTVVGLGYDGERRAIYRVQKDGQQETFETKFVLTKAGSEPVITHLRIDVDFQIPQGWDRDGPFEDIVLDEVVRFAGASDKNWSGKTGYRGNYMAERGSGRDYRAPVSEVRSNTLIRTMV